MGLPGYDEWRTACPPEGEPVDDREPEPTSDMERFRERLATERRQRVLAQMERADHEDSVGYRDTDVGY
jgi:hypothetical protein